MKKAFFIVVNDSLEFSKATKPYIYYNRFHIDKYRYDVYYHIDIHQCEVIAWS